VSIDTEFLDILGLKAVVGAEIEFYLTNYGQCFVDFIGKYFANRNRDLPSIVPEKGKDQFEAQIRHSADIAKIACDLVLFRSAVDEYSNVFAVESSFSAKPFDNQPGSALHINLSVLDTNQNNVFAKHDDLESPILLNVIGGLCLFMARSMVYFAPNPDSYRRYLFSDIDTPTTVSWGGNNRTVAVRIPTSCPINRRIEHRVAGADSDPYLVIKAIIKAVEYGIEYEIMPSAKIYGVAHDKQYSLPKLPISLKEAEKCHVDIF
jgi:glutamine synthetase